MAFVFAAFIGSLLTDVTPVGSFERASALASSTYIELPALKINRRRNKERGGGIRSLQFVNEEF